MKKIKEYLKLLRVKHYFKNLLVFLPLIFSGELLDVNRLMTCILGFISFCLISSVVYIINDIKDIENDRNHEVKKHRPLASGAILKSSAITVAIILLLSVTFINILFIKPRLLESLIMLFTYLVINIAYSFGLKKKPIIDILVLVLGFLLRVLYGSTITSIEVSNWLYLTVISASFYMGLGKRRNEIIKQGAKSREVLKSYTKEFLDKNMYVCLALCIVFYSLWSVDINTLSRINNGNLLVWTVPIIMVILMKYSLDIEGDSYGDPVDVLLGDKVLLITVLLYGLFMFGLIYLI